MADNSYRFPRLSDCSRVFLETNSDITCVSGRRSHGEHPWDAIYSRIYSEIYRV